MGFSISVKAAGDKAVAALTESVNKAMADAKPDEHATVKEVADVLFESINGATADEFVEAHASGARGTRQRSLSFSVQVSTLTPEAPPVAKPAEVPTWKPPAS